MRLGVDASSVNPDGKGISRAQQGLVRALAELGRYELFAYVRDPAARALLGDVETRAIDGRRALRWEQVGMRRALREVDVLLTLGDRLPIGVQGRIVVWLFEPPTHRIARNREVGASVYQRASDVLTQALWRHSLRKAGAVVATSASTARELDVDAAVVYPGLDGRFSPGPGRAGRYVFHLGSSDPRDNTEAVLDAFRLVDGDAELVVAGGLGALDAPLRARSGDRVSFLGRVSDEELVSLYRGAAAYVDASLYEGFGYQVLEAMACGAPVVASDTSSIPEVVGDAGVLCDPRDPAAFARALTRVLADAELAADLRRRGLAQAATFTWRRTAERLAEVVDRVAR